MLTTHTQQQILKTAVRAGIILSVIGAIAVALLFFLLYRGSSWLYDAYRNGRPNTPRAALWNPFAKNESNNTSSVQVKVVSEESAVIDVVKQASPAVVSIIASAEVPRLEQCYQRDDLFNFDFPTLCQRGTQLQRVGAGSGFLVSGDGYIMTNRHVVADEKAEYTVVLNDKKNFGKKLKARVLARDAERDIAVLKVDANDLPFLSFGDSGIVQVGQTAIAIGYSLGQFDNTVSKGVVSGLSRSVSAGGGGIGVEELRGLVQTDAAINPGNSGGPLLDIAGNVIGMNVAMADGQSIGFAIPGNAAKKAYEDVKAHGKITAEERAFLGVRYVPVTSELQAANKLPYDYGMLVSRGRGESELAVMPGSPADKAGIVENDIILEADGKQLNERMLLSDAVEGKKPGDTIRLNVYHKGETKEMTVALGKR